MLVGLYTVRIKLGILGIEDYGIYNVVGGVVVMFTFLNGAMTQATQRFLNFAMGQNDTEQARNVFSISFIIHILIAVLVVILAETIGLSFFYTILNIPTDRYTAALIVYQFSVVTTVIGVLQVPYNATIIAYEKMSFFALLSIVEAFLKLGIVFLLAIILFDKLMVYAFLVSIVGLIIFFTYKVYCNRMFEVAHFRFNKDKTIFRQLASFSGWSVFGQFANVCRNKGIEILINIFHGVAMNAAMGIAMQVNTAVYAFVSNFQTAFRPQIIKSYAANDNIYFTRLIFRSSKVSYYLLFFFVLPLYINADFVLQMWLKIVPEYSVMFTRLMLIYSLEIAISGPLWMAIQATGEIKKYQIILSCLTFANLPLSFLFLYLCFSPVWVLVIKIALSVVIFIWRLSYMKERINFPVIDFLHEAIIPILIITGISCLAIYSFSTLFIDWTKLLLSCIVSTLCIGSLVYLVGINKQEKRMVLSWVKSKIFKEKY